jgi:hypothetical protein
VTHPPQNRELSGHEGEMLLNGAYLVDVSRVDGLRELAVEREVALVDLVDRLLGGGVVIAGDITLAVADVDLVHVSLRALVSSVATAEKQP